MGGKWEELRDLTKSNELERKTRLHGYWVPGEKPTYIEVPSSCDPDTYRNHLKRIVKRNKLGFQKTYASADNDETVNPKSIYSQSCKFKGAYLKEILQKSDYSEKSDYIAAKIAEWHKEYDDVPVDAAEKNTSFTQWYLSISLFTGMLLL